MNAPHVAHHERIRARRETRVPQLGTYEALVEEMALELGLTKKTVREVLEAFGRTLAQTVWETGRVSIPGIGVFRVRSVKGRRIANPVTGRAMRLPPMRVVKARVAREWRTR
jgi:DNA-binding protein HU-beta